MQGFNSSIKDRYKEKWVKSVSGSGPRQKTKSKSTEKKSTKQKPRIVTDESKKPLRKRKHNRRQRALAVKK